jgi:predicted dehydrogenase
MIGAGMVGQLCHLAHYARNPDCRVVGLAELRPELGKLVAAKFGVPKIYDSHRELLEDPNVDAVVVVTRRTATGPIVLDALQSGRHVLSEKPMAHTVARGRLLAETARSSDLVYAVGYMKRHDAGIARGKMEIDRAMNDGSLGALIQIRGWCFGGNVGEFGSDFAMTAESRPDGLTLWSLGPDWMPSSCLPRYDAFLNVNIHIINLLRYLAGKTPTVTDARFDDDKHIAVTLEFDDVPGALELNTVDSQRWNEGCEFVFERGQIRIELPPPFQTNAEARVELTGAKGAVLPQGQSWAFVRQANAFVQALKDHVEPLAPGIDAVADLEVAEAVWRRLLGVEPELRPLSAEQLRARSLG